jgi:hypothetical protein
MNGIGDPYSIYKCLSDTFPAVIWRSLRRQKPPGIRHGLIGYFENYHPDEKPGFSNVA